MKRTLLVSMILSFALAGCSLLYAPGGSLTPAPPDGGQGAGQGAGATEPAGATETATSTPVEIIPIPVSSVMIEGVPYSAWQMPGDPFRFVCQDPCALDLEYIYAEYAAFRVAHAMMLELTGVDTLPELQPVDMHLDFEDSVCSPFPYGHAWLYEQAHQAHTCTDGPGWYPTLEEKLQKAALPGEQYFLVHEYMHTLFFGRISGTGEGFYDYRAEHFHDYIVQVPSFAIGILPREDFCTYRDPAPPGDFGGRLILNLCEQNGFELPDLAASLVALDNLYQSGGGLVPQAGFEHPAPTVAQYRDILNDLLGSDTTQAFADACWPPGLFGNSYSLPPACLVVEATSTPLK